MSVAMSKYEVYSVKPLTNGSGAATAYTPKITGLLIACAYIKTDYGNGGTFAITGNDTAQGIWSEAAVNATAQRNPRTPTHSLVGVASLYDTSDNEPVESAPALFDEQIKVVIAGKGDTKTGEFRFLVEH